MSSPSTQFRALSMIDVQKNVSKSSRVKMKSRRTEKPQLPVDRNAEHIHSQHKNLHHKAGEG